jgi:hypothetical protein
MPLIFAAAFGFAGVVHMAVYAWPLDQCGDTRVIAAEIA